MNTLANHGYINRNGITTVAQTVVAAARVFNMGAYVQSQTSFVSQIADSPTEIWQLFLQAAQSSLQATFRQCDTLLVVQTLALIRLAV